MPLDAEVALAVARVSAAAAIAALDAGATPIQRDGDVVGGIDVADFDRGDARSDLG